MAVDLLSSSSLAAAAVEEIIRNKISPPAKHAYYEANMSPSSPFSPPPGPGSTSPATPTAPPSLPWQQPAADPVADAAKSAILAHRTRLPIHAFRPHFLNAVSTHQVVVVVGETGSGKSTQMPQYLHESGLLQGAGRIAVTQPRRVAAMSVAQRVAQEMGCQLGGPVGYSIRFEDVSGPQTQIKFMTDGLLLMECLKEPLFSNYSCVILDEAHERTLHTDVLLGLLKKAIRARPDLRVVITSATLDIKKFADYFNAPMIKIPGSMFPVFVDYLPSPELALLIKAKASQAYLEDAVKKVLKIHYTEPGPGDILLFLPGKDEVEQACLLLSKAARAQAARAARAAQKGQAAVPFVPLPVYAALPFEAQCAIFSQAAPDQRKIIVATNIAETSLTIDGILFVVDTGLFKESISDHDIETLRVAVISRAQAEQRAGRAGRTAPGKCFRMYAKQDYQAMKDVPSPAIHRIDFTATALQLKVMGINDICGFGFMDPPYPERVSYSLARLHDLGALDQFHHVTELGYKMAEFPLSPHLAKVLLTAANMECSDEALTIVSMLSSANQHIFLRPQKRQREADQRKMRFNDYKGDHMTLLNVFNAWQAAAGQSASVVGTTTVAGAAPVGPAGAARQEEWARENFVNHKELEKASDIRRQLLSIMTAHNVPVVSCGGRRLANIRRVLTTAGLPNNVACRDPSSGRGAYRTLLDQSLVYVHPSSSLFRQQSELVIYHETLTTSRTFMRIVSVCERAWLPKGALTAKGAAPHSGGGFKCGGGGLGSAKYRGNLW